jgi:hypothetical protein
MPVHSQYHDDEYELIDIDLYISPSTLNLCMGVINERIDTFGDDPAFRTLKHALIELRYQLGYDPLLPEVGDNIVIFAKFYGNTSINLPAYDDYPLDEWFLIDEIEYHDLKLELTDQDNQELYDVNTVGAIIKVIDLTDADRRAMFKEYYPDLYCLIQERFTAYV